MTCFYCGTSRCECGKRIEALVLARNPPPRTLAELEAEAAQWREELRCKARAFVEAEKLAANLGTTLSLEPLMSAARRAIAAEDLVTARRGTDESRLKNAQDKWNGS